MTMMNYFYEWSDSARVRSEQDIMDIVAEVRAIFNKAEQNEEVIIALDGEDFGLPQRDELRAVLRATDAKLEEYEMVMANKYNLHQTILEKWQRLEQSYARDRETVAALVKDDKAVMHKLALDQRPRQRLLSWLNRGEDFYWLLRNDPPLQQVAAQAKITLAAIDAIMIEMEEIRAIRHTYILANLRGGGVTGERERIIDKLVTHFVGFKVAVRSALQDQPQLLAAIGIEPD
jgi:hypothetical protein